MRPLGPWLLVVAALMPLSFPGPSAGQEANVPTAQVNEAIRRGIAFLRDQQRDDGCWQYPGTAEHNLGLTALAALALLENGEPEDDPAIARASDFIRSELASNIQTYDIALAILFLSRMSERGDEANDRLIQRLASRLERGGPSGGWSYLVPTDADLGATEDDGDRNRDRRRNRAFRPAFMPSGDYDNSNTQFALLGLWAAGRHGFASSPGLKAVEEHFRSTVENRSGWGYKRGYPPQNAMTCAGLMALAIGAARPERAERQTAKSRGAELAADPLFQAALETVSRDARAIGGQSDIYYLWSLERVCVALGLRKLDGFDWYEAGARELLSRQDNDGGWPNGQWGRLPCTALALLFLRKANLAFELDRVLKLPGAVAATAPLMTVALEPEQAPAEGGTAPQAGDDGPQVVVTGANDANFPEIAVDFELRDSQGGFLLDAQKEDFKVFEEGREVAIDRFLSPYGDPQPITVVLVVDRSGSMQEEDRIGGLKAAVGTFLGGLPKGSKVAVVAFGSEVQRICPFTEDFEEAQATVNRLRPAGATRYYDAVADALELIQTEKGRRAVLALTDGEDTFSQSADLNGVTTAARRLGLPIYTLGLGSEDEIESDALKALAAGTRGQYYPAREADQLRKIYQQLAERLRSSYTVVYRSDRKIPDGTLRPVRVSYRQSKRSGETAVFIPGMVVPAPGWSRLFLLLVGVLAALFARPWARLTST